MILEIKYCKLKVYSPIENQRRNKSREENLSQFHVFTIIIKQKSDTYNKHFYYMAIPNPAF